MKNFCLNIVLIISLVSISQNTSAQVAFELKTNDLAKAENIITDKDELSPIEAYEAFINQEEKQEIQTTNEDDNDLRFTFLNKEEEAKINQKMVKKNWFKLSILPINDITLSIGFVTAL